MKKLLTAIGFCVLTTGCTGYVDIIGDGEVRSSKALCTAENAPCAVTVAGTFNEYFAAKPSPGWRFDSWKGCPAVFERGSVCDISADSDLVAALYGRDLTKVPLVARFVRIAEFDSRMVYRASVDVTSCEAKGVDPKFCTNFDGGRDAFIHIELGPNQGWAKATFNSYIAGTQTQIEEGSLWLDPPPAPGMGYNFNHMFIEGFHSDKMEREGDFLVTGDYLDGSYSLSLDRGEFTYILSNRQGTLVIRGK